MLLIEVSQIPPEGLDVHEVLQPGEVHVEGEDSFMLEPESRLDCHIERGDDDTVQVRGHLKAMLRLQCGRCLESFLFPVDQDLDLFFLPHRADQDQEEEDEVELTDHEMVVAYYAQNRLDLGETVREQFFLGLPMKRVCREACLGICPSCGTNRNQTPCACPPEVPEDDPRLAPLRKLFDRGSS